MPDIKSAGRLRQLLPAFIDGIASNQTRWGQGRRGWDGILGALLGVRCSSHDWGQWWQSWSNRSSKLLLVTKLIATQLARLVAAHNAHVTEPPLPQARLIQLAGFHQTVNRAHVTPMETEKPLILPALSRDPSNVNVEGTRVRIHLPMRQHQQGWLLRSCPTHLNRVCIVQVSGVRYKVHSEPRARSWQLAGGGRIIQRMPMARNGHILKF
jgi:hypothetical protein